MRGAVPACRWRSFKGSRLRSMSCRHRPTAATKPDAKIIVSFKQSFKRELTTAASFNHPIPIIVVCRAAGKKVILVSGSQCVVDGLPRIVPPRRLIRELKLTLYSPAGSASRYITHYRSVGCCRLGVLLRELSETTGEKQCHRQWPALSKTLTKLHDGSGKVRTETRLRLLPHCEV